MVGLTSLFWSGLCKKWKCTYFKSKIWYNKEFNLRYWDKWVQIWFLSLPWQRLDISIFLRDFFVVKQYVPHPNLSGSHVCTQRNFHHVQAKKSYDEKWFLSELPLCRVLPVLTPQFSPMRMMHLVIVHNQREISLFNFY